MHRSDAWRQAGLDQTARQVSRLQIDSPLHAGSRLASYRLSGRRDLPFGTKTSMTVYAEATLFALPTIYINGGKRGYLVSMGPGELERVLNPIKVEVAID